MSSFEDILLLFKVYYNSSDMRLFTSFSLRIFLPINRLSSYATKIIPSIIK